MAETSHWQGEILTFGYQSSASTCCLGIPGASVGSRAIRKAASCLRPGTSMSDSTLLSPQRQLPQSSSVAPRWPPHHQWLQPHQELGAGGKNSLLTRQIHSEKRSPTPRQKASPQVRVQMNRPMAGTAELETSNSTSQLRGS